MLDCLPLKVLQVVAWEGRLCVADVFFSLRCVNSHLARLVGRYMRPSRDLNLDALVRAGLDDFWSRGLPVAIWSDPMHSDDAVAAVRRATATVLSGLRAATPAAPAVLSGSFVLNYVVYPRPFDEDVGDVDLFTLGAVDSERTVWPASATTYAALRAGGGNIVRGEALAVVGAQRWRAAATTATLPPAPAWDRRDVAYVQMAARRRFSSYHMQLLPHTIGPYRRHDEPALNVIVDVVVADEQLGHIRQGWPSTTPARFLECVIGTFDLAVCRVAVYADPARPGAWRFYAAAPDALAARTSHVTTLATITVERAQRLAARVAKYARRGFRTIVDASLFNRIERVLFSAAAHSLKEYQWNRRKELDAVEATLRGTTPDDSSEHARMLRRRRAVLLEPDARTFGSGIPRRVTEALCTLARAATIVHNDLHSLADAAVATDHDQAVTYIQSRAADEIGPVRPFRPMRASAPSLPRLPWETTTDDDLRFDGRATAAEGGFDSEESDDVLDGADHNFGAVDDADNDM